MHLMKIVRALHNAQLHMLKSMEYFNGRKPIKIVTYTVKMRQLQYANKQPKQKQNALILEYKLATPFVIYDYDLQFRLSLTL